MTEHVDMSKFVEAKSDQLNADDLLGAPRTITITSVRGCDGDQPIAIHYQGDNGKPFKPCKTIRRVLLAIWGRNAAEYVGRSMTLYRDDSVTFGGLNVGGIRISHMSHLEKETVVVVMKTKGKKAGITVKPLVVSAPAANGRAKAEAWVEDFIAKLEQSDVPATEALFARSQSAMAKLQKEHPDLHEKLQRYVPTPEADPFDETPASEQAVAKIKADMDAAPTAKALERVIHDAVPHYDALDDDQKMAVETAISAARARFGESVEA
jgi:hypothetical protein